MSPGDTASNLGSAVDELMRHQPTLKTDATTAIIKVWRSSSTCSCSHKVYEKLKVYWSSSFWKRFVTWVEPLSTSARNHLSRKQMVLWWYLQHAQAMPLKRLQVRTKRKRRLFTHSANNKGKQRAPDSQCHLNCMMHSCDEFITKQYRMSFLFDLHFLLNEYIFVIWFLTFFAFLQSGWHWGEDTHPTNGLHSKCGKTRLPVYIW